MKTMVQNVQVELLFQESEGLVFVLSVPTKKSTYPVYPQKPKDKLPFPDANIREGIISQAQIHCISKLAQQLGEEVNFEGMTKHDASLKIQELKRMFTQQPSEERTKKIWADITNQIKNKSGKFWILLRKFIKGTK